MGKALVVKDVDYSSVCIIDTIVSSEQESLGENTYIKDNGQVGTYSGIEGVAFIDIPANISELILDTGDYQPSALSFFNNNNEYIGKVPSGSSVGLIVDRGDAYSIPEGATKFSYVYKNSIQSFNLGLNLTWLGQ